MTVATHASSFWNRQRVRHPTAAVVVSALAVGAGVLVAAAPASANVSHAFTTSFGAASSTPTNPYPLSGPTDVEVDQTSHDIYVTDPGNHRVEKFDSSGNVILMFGKEVNKTAVENSRTAEENVCPAAGHPADVCQPGTLGSGAGQFESPTYLAVDNSGGSSNGDIYVGDTGDNLVSKFDSSGNLITGWGPGGQKDGSDATDLPVFGPLFGVAVGANGNLFVGGHHYSDNEWEYKQDGTYVKWFASFAETWLRADPTGNEIFYFGAGGTVFKAIPDFACNCQDTNQYQLGTDTPLTGFALDPSSHEVYQDTGSVIDHYSDCNPPQNGPCNPEDSFGSGQLFGSMGVGVDGASHAVYVANSTGNEVAVFGDVRPIVTTSQPTNVTESSVTLTGHIDPAGRGGITSCHFEYGFDKTYGTTLPCTPDPASNPPGSNFTAPTEVTATITGLSPGTKDHYRVVASNSAGATSDGADETFITTQPPAIDGLQAENLTATSAELIAEVNPNGLKTTYQFKYGPSKNYGEVEPKTEGTIPASNADQRIEVSLSNLTPHIVYHYTLVVKNEDGTTTAPDHTFNFYPPNCPNENLRQQTQANFLPDCRAYELVSPGNAGGTQLFSGGPNTGRATNPSRFSYVGLFSSIPNSGGSPIDGAGDLYVATRTDSGWISRYVGLPSSEAGLDGGPPQATVSFGFSPDKIQNGVLSDPSMSTFLDWNLGNVEPGGPNPTPVASNAPYVWGADGSLLDRWPTNLATVPDGVHRHLNDQGETTLVESGGTKALDCPPEEPSAGNGFGGTAFNDCPGDVTASSDLSHFVFATEWNVFAPGGQLSAPGSVYDNNTRAGTVAVASKTPSGDDIQSEPTDGAGDPLRIPAVSNDGSHVLIAAGGTGPCGQSGCPIPACGHGIAEKCPLQPSHLYMRVDGTVTYDVSQGHDVNYVGMTADGSKVYFTTSQQLTPEDTDTSTDLYMWSEATNSITLISKGSNGMGNSDTCNASFTTKCGVVIYSDQPFCQLPSGLGGNCLSDNFIASQNGDIYFFSPEQLDGSRGLPNRENLYDYRNGQAQYVTTMTTGPVCFTNPFEECTNTPVARMQVSPDDSHMAFVTASPVTQYDNAGHLEMYTYEPSAGTIACVSCIPSGARPTSDVAASQDGLFMTNDGRTFFTTEDALVKGDTNQAQDVYEYVDGRPQLITQGTGDTAQARGGLVSNSSGLVGVSADGRDVYFAGFQTLVRQDHNGLFLKFYDARAGGGFPAPAPPPPCAAADECHGPGSSPPADPHNGTNTLLGAGGNAERASTRHHKKHRKRSLKRHHRALKRHHARAAGAKRRVAR